MRRGFSIFLILLFGLGPLSATLEASDDAGLPPCCRRHGAHHCAMAMQMAAAEAQSDSRPAFSAPLTCPYYPGATAAILAPVPALIAVAARLPALMAQAYRSAIARTAAHSNPSRTHAGRGPPREI
ncbi:MAG: hypothetical protein WBE72_01135 [Terracidiphilus sp.]